MRRVVTRQNKLKASLRRNVLELRFSGASPSGAIPSPRAAIPSLLSAIYIVLFPVPIHKDHSKVGDVHGVFGLSAKFIGNEV